MKITEVTTPTPEQQRIRAMQAQVKRAQEAIKAERDRQKIHRAQQQISQVTNPKSPSVV
ncbi:MAG: hypothetical protein NTX83_05000 [Burkholderiales bacterium]|nr:hypothetical protein [Burkholderiales bacterium]